jgi:hypothetical protein
MGMDIVVREEHPWNTPSPILLIAGDKEIELNDVHPKNALFPMPIVLVALFELSGITTDIKSVFPEKNPGSNILI